MTREGLPEPLTIDPSLTPHPPQKSGTGTLDGEKYFLKEKEKYQRRWKGKKRKTREILKKYVP